MTSLFSRIAAWAKNTIPSREQLEENRFVRPFAQRPELWRFTRRSVPRGVAIGLFVGIFALIPGIQIVGAALMCVPWRGNIPIAAAMTFLSNPATTPFILVASLYIGGRLGYKADITTFNAMLQRGADMHEWTHWLLSDAAPALLVGLFVISAVAAIIGYIVSAIGWRIWIGRQRTARREAALTRDDKR